MAQGGCKEVAPHGRFPATRPFLPVWPIPHTLKFIKNAVIFIEGAQLAAEVVVNLEGQGKHIKKVLVINI